MANNNQIAGLATGLAQGINTYLGKQQESDLETKKLNTTQSLMEQRQKDLESQRNTDKLGQMKAKDALETPLDGDTAEQLYPGSGKQFVDTFTKNTGKPPTFKDGFAALAQAAGAKTKASNADAAQSGKETTQLTKYQQMYNTNSKKEQDGMNAVDTATQQILSATKNPVSAASVPITLARMMTGTSRINTMEIQKLGGSQAVGDKLNQIATTMSQGTLTPENQKYMLDLSNVLHRSHQQNLIGIGKQTASQYGKVSGKDVKSAYSDITGSDMPADDHPAMQPALPEQTDQNDPLGLLGKK